MMEEKEAEGLKKLSPKFMKVETNDPEVAEEVLEMQPELNEESEDDDMKRLLEMYKNL